MRRDQRQDSFHWSKSNGTDESIPVKEVKNELVKQEVEQARAIKDPDLGEARIQNLKRPPTCFHKLPNTQIQKVSCKCKFSIMRCNHCGQVVRGRRNLKSHYVTACNKESRMRWQETLGLRKNGKKLLEGNNIAGQHKISKMATGSKDIKETDIKQEVGECLLNPNKEREENLTNPLKKLKMEGNMDVEQVIFAVRDHIHPPRIKKKHKNMEEWVDKARLAKLKYFQCFFCGHIVKGKHNLNHHHARICNNSSQVKIENKQLTYGNLELEQGMMKPKKLIENFRYAAVKQEPPAEAINSKDFRKLVNKQDGNICLVKTEKTGGEFMEDHVKKLKIKVKQETEDQS